jgi:hypothetical protein
VILTVSDSGKGISQDYLRHRLFTPFAQEDSFAPGTGLGLSLVRQMAITLGGNIDVASRVGQGTTVTVTMPLVQARGHATKEKKQTHGEDKNEVEQETGEEEDEELVFKQNIAALAGLRVMFRGFDTRVRVREGFRRQDKKQKHQMALLQGICQDWLGMQVVTEGSQKSLPDVVVCSSHGYCADTAVHDGGGKGESGSNAGVGECGEGRLDLDGVPHVFIHQSPTALYDSTGTTALKRKKGCRQGQDTHIIQPYVFLLFALSFLSFPCLDLFCG